VYLLTLVHSLITIKVAPKAGGKDAAKRDQTRANKESGDRMTSGGHIGGPFKVSPSPAFLDTRSAYFETLWEIQEKSVAEKQGEKADEITITLPDKSEKKGIAFKTSPFDIIKTISQSQQFADSFIIAKVCYSSRLDGDFKVVQVDDEADEGRGFLTPHFQISIYSLLFCSTVLLLTFGFYSFVSSHLFLPSLLVFAVISYIVCRAVLCCTLSALLFCALLSCPVLFCSFHVCSYLFSFPLP
jgi:hypothetical protein